MRSSTTFKKGHKKIGGFGKGDKHTDEAKIKVRRSLIGNSRRWLGDDAGYVAKHMWISKQFGKAGKCENPNCTFINPRRFEWANLSGTHRRARHDYVQLCPSCHRKMDIRKITFKQLCEL